VSAIARIFPTFLQQQRQFYRQENPKVEERKMKKSERNHLTGRKKIASAKSKSI
jgi:hypothetical protein